MKSEIELARRVIQWLQDLRWEIYQEVQVFQGGNIADIVAVQAPVTWVIETKTTLSLAVIGQAYEWTNWTNRVSVATLRRRRRSQFAEKILKDYGIGLLLVSEVDVDWKGSIEERCYPRFHRKVGKHLIGALNEAHKTYAEAGNNQGRHWSPFKETCLMVRRYVMANPGCGIKDLVNSVDHHYASNSTARICIARWAEVGAIENVRVERDGKFLRFYPIGEDGVGHQGELAGYED